MFDYLDGKIESISQASEKRSSENRTQIPQWCQYISERDRPKLRERILHILMGKI